MPYAAEHLTQPPTRDALDQRAGLTVVEFGTPWCGFCRRAQPSIEQALGPRDDIALVKVEDGPGQRLGRSYGVKLWPTLIFLRDGQEMARLVRPADATAISDALAGAAT